MLIPNFKDFGDQRLAFYQTELFLMYIKNKNQKACLYINIITAMLKTTNKLIN